MPAKVSIITPCYNSAKFVGRTIESVRAQTLESWEHIVVDDGSTDASATVLADQAKRDPRLQVMSKANGGVASARNAGYRLCSPDAEYLLFLDADDCLEPGMLEEMTEYLASRADVGMVYCDRRFVDESDRPIDPKAHKIPANPRYARTRFGFRRLTDDVAETPFEAILSLADGILPSVSLIRRSVYQMTPGWDEKFGQHYEDTDLILQIAVRSGVHFLPRKLVRYRRHAGQSTGDCDRYEGQMEKLFDKWRHMKGLTAEQSRVVREAIQFREGRIVPYQGMVAAFRYLSAGEWASSLRFFGGAARRYAASFAN